MIFECFCFRARYPAHIIYHGPEYFNRGTDGDPTAYMTLNFQDGLSSHSGTGTGTEVLTLSDRHSGPSPIDRSSWEQVIMSDMKPMPRRESKTFPIMKEIKHLLEAVHMRRIRTLSAHLSRAEVETLRRQFTPDTTNDGTHDSGTHDSGTHDRTRSTIALERTQSSIRPLSEISEHFYYSLFPDPRNRPDRNRLDSGLSGVGMGHFNGYENEGAKDRDSGRPSSSRRSRNSRSSLTRPLSSPTFSPRSVTMSGQYMRPPRPRLDEPREQDENDDATDVEDIDIVDETTPMNVGQHKNGDEKRNGGDHPVDSTDEGDAESLAPERTEMVENEIYEPYSGDVESDD